MGCLWWVTIHEASQIGFGVWGLLLGFLLFRSAVICYLGDWVLGGGAESQRC